VKTIKLILAALLLAAPITVSSAQDAKPAVVKPGVGGYDIASCSLTGFASFHIDIQPLSGDLKFTEVVDEAGKLEYVEFVYTFHHADSSMRHYMSPSGKSELVLKYEDEVTAGRLISGDEITLVYGMQADGTEVVAHSKFMFGVCTQFRENIKLMTPKENPNAESDKKI